MFNIQFIKEFVDANDVDAVEFYRFNSPRKSIHTDYVVFDGFDLLAYDDETKVELFELMDYESYSNSIEANTAPTFSESEFKEMYPNGILVVILK